MPWRCAGWSTSSGPACGSPSVTSFSPILFVAAQPGLQVVPHGARFAHPPDPTAHDEFRRCVARRYQIVGLSETAKRWRSPLVDTGEVARIARSAVGEVPHQRARHPEPYHRRREPSSAAAGLGGWAAVRGDE
jgi:hypothetical protein